MANTRTSTSIRVVILALLATVASAGLLTAEDYSGKFTLPFETKWGTATLPPGEYEFKLNMDAAPYTVRISGVSGTTFAFANGWSEVNRGDQSSLVVVRRGRKGTVRSLHLADQGKFFTYSAPKIAEPLLAQEPQLIQRIPVLVAHK